METTHPDHARHATTVRDGGPMEPNYVVHCRCGWRSGIATMNRKVADDAADRHRLEAPAEDQRAAELAELPLEVWDDPHRAVLLLVSWAGVTTIPPTSDGVAICRLEELALLSITGLPAEHRPTRTQIERVAVLAYREDDPAPADDEDDEGPATVVGWQQPTGSAVNMAYMESVPAGWFVQDSRSDPAHWCGPYDTADLALADVVGMLEPGQAIQWHGPWPVPALEVAADAPTPTLVSFECWRCREGIQHDGLSWASTSTGALVCAGTNLRHTPEEPF